MASTIPIQNISFLYPSKENKKLPSNSKTEEKISPVANQALEKNGTTWYVEVPPTQKPPVIAKLSPDRVHIISEALKTPKTKEKPTPSPRSSTTCSDPAYSKIGEQEKVLGPGLLSAVVNAKNALKPTDKKIPPTPFPRSHTTCLSPTSEHSNIEKAPAKNTPPPPPPQENKPKFKPVSVTTPTSPLERKVSFQREETTKDLKANSSATLPTKGILKQTSSFSNTEENKPHNATSPSTKIHSSPESSEKLNEEKEWTSVLDELNAVLEDLGIDPVQDFPK